MEILFRGETIGNVNTKDGLWVFGLPFYKDGKIGGIESKDGKLYTVIPETVGQYTGLTDKNGKKIFEGDIVKVTILNDYPCCVAFKDYTWYFVPIDKMINEVRLGTLTHAIYEIIGNIHNNPEFLNKPKGDENDT